MTIATTLWLLAIAALLGVFLVVRGWRGRRIDDHPLCRKCGYDLHANASPARCPECGRDLAASSRRVRIGHRRKRRLSLALGSLLLFLSLGGAGVMTWAAASDFDWITVKPLWMLKRDADGSTDGALRERSEEEIMRRLFEDRLAQSDIDRIVLEGAALRSARYSLQAQWREAFIIQGWLVTSISDAAFSQYLKSLMVGSLRLEIRGNVRRGTRQKIVVHYTSPFAPYLTVLDTGIYVETELHGLWHDERKIADLDGSMRMSQFSVGYTDRSQSMSDEAVIDLPPGLYNLRAECTMRFGVDAPGASKRHVDLTHRLEDLVGVFDSKRPDVTLQRDESVRIALLRALNATWCVRDGADGEQLIECDVAAQRLPVDVAFDVVLCDGGQLFTIGSFAISRDRPLSQHFARALTDADQWLTTRSQVDVLLRPSIATSEVTPGIFTIWDGEIVLEDVLPTIHR